MRVEEVQHKLCQHINKWCQVILIARIVAKLLHSIVYQCIIRGIESKFGRIFTHAETGTLVEIDHHCSFSPQQLHNCCLEVTEACNASFNQSVLSAPNRILFWLQDVSDSCNISYQSLECSHMTELGLLCYENNPSCKKITLSKRSQTKVRECLGMRLISPTLVHSRRSVWGPEKKLWLSMITSLPSLQADDRYYWGFAQKRLPLLLSILLHTSVQGL